MLVALLTRAMLWALGSEQARCCTWTIYHGPVAFAAVCAWISLLALLCTLGAVGAAVLSAEVRSVYPAAWLLFAAPPALLAACIGVELLLVWLYRTPIPSMRAMLTRRRHPSGDDAAFARQPSVDEIELTEAPFH